MNIQEQGFPLDLGASFTEDAPRPPVPGEEGELVSTDPRPVSHSFCSGKGAGIKGETSTATPRRSDLDLGYEPEGSASPTPPYLKWAESLHSLLDDQDGINLFRTFLKQEDCADLLDFWFACSGFRKLEPCDSNEEKRLKLARAIYRKYILDNNGIVSRQTKPATKSFIKDCISKQQIDPAMFDQAQTEVQSTMEEARRRLEEEEKRASKAPSKQRTKSQRKAGGGSTQPCDSIVVAYYFCGEPIPYRTLVRGRAVTLGQFKELLTKKGNYRFYFKKVSDEFECGVVFEEVREDTAVLPVFEEKIIGKVEKVD